MAQTSEHIHAKSKLALGEQHLWQDRNGVPMQILASSEHARLLSEVDLSSRQDNAPDIIFQEHRDGLIYVEGDEVAPKFMKLLPEGVTAAAGAKGSTRPC